MRIRIKIYNYEIANLIVLILLIPMYVYTLSIAPDHTIMIISLFAGMFISTGLLIWQFFKMNLIRKVNYANDTIAQTAGTLLKVKLWLKKERIMQFFIFPPYLLTVFVAVIFLVQNQNLFEVLDAYLPRIIFAYILATFITLFIYKNMFSKIKKIKDKMQELEEIIS